MQAFSKLPSLRFVLGSITTLFILTAIILELLPENVAKIFVVPILIAALIAGISQTSLSKKH